MTFCGKCGTQSADEDEFCRSCGTRLSLDEPGDTIGQSVDSSLGAESVERGVPIIPPSAQGVNIGLSRDETGARRKPVKGYLVTALVIVVIVVAILVKTLGGGDNATGAGAIPSQWVKWNKHFDPLFSTMDTTYKQIGTALANDNISKATLKFQQYEYDSTLLIRDANSPSKIINADIRKLGGDGLIWSEWGYKDVTEPGDVSPSALTAYTNTLIAELKKFTRDLNKYE